ACPTDWVRFRGTCIHVAVGSTAMTWTACRGNCTSSGAEMLCIPDEATNAFVHSLISYDLWLGYSDAAVEGVWEWNSPCVSSFTKWHGPEPNNIGPSNAPNADYCLMYDSSFWDDQTSNNINYCGCQ
ncbi:unnamed protein product, partial [Ectocarpus fasciculatus]